MAVRQDALKVPAFADRAEPIRRHVTHRAPSHVPISRPVIPAGNESAHLRLRRRLPPRRALLSHPRPLANRVGSWLGVGNDSTYNHSDCLEKFPFPDASEAKRTRIRDLAERLDAHRKRQQREHPQLTLTDLYNVLEKLRTGEALTPKEQRTHEHGLVTVLRELHDQLDAAVAEAYALPPTAPDEAILTHLCALNAQRAAEERAGKIRYLRPAFQNPASTATQTQLATGEETTASPTKPAAKLAWPKSFAEQALAVRTALTSFAAPADAATLARTFKNAKTDRIEDILETLASLGQARGLSGDRYVAG